MRTATTVALTVFAGSSLSLFAYWYDKKHRLLENASRSRTLCLHHTGKINKSNWQRTDSGTAEVVVTNRRSGDLSPTSRRCEDSHSWGRRGRNVNLTTAILQREEASDPSQIHAAWTSSVHIITDYERKSNHGTPDFSEIVETFSNSLRMFLLCIFSKRFGHFARASRKC